MFFNRTNSGLFRAFPYGLAVFALAISMVLPASLGSALQTSDDPSGLGGPLGALNEPTTFAFQDVDADTAEKMNASVPVFSGRLDPARPFDIASGTEAAQTRLTALDCLTAAVYFEAASETDQGQRAVAQVVLNRVRHPAYPNSVCGVVFQGSERRTGCQFSFTCDGAMNRRPSSGGWSRARGVAALALAGFVEPSVGLATHYHTKWVVPYWSANLNKIAVIGAHIFYRWQGNAGTPGAFSGRYAQNEAAPGRFLDGSLKDLLASAMTEASASTGLDGLSLPVDEIEQAFTGAPAAPASPLPSRKDLAVDESKGPGLLADENRGTLLLD